MATKKPAPISHSRLDIFHKGVYPTAAILLAAAALYVGVTQIRLQSAQKRMQQEIDELRVRAKQLADAEQKAEEASQSLRELICLRILLEKGAEIDVVQRLHALAPLLMIQMADKRNFGTKGDEMWANAETRAKARLPAAKNGG